MRDPLLHLHDAAELLNDAARELRDPSERRRAATTLATVARTLLRFRAPVAALASTDSAVTSPQPIDRTRTASSAAAAASPPATNHADRPHADLPARSHASGVSPRPSRDGAEDSPLLRFRGFRRGPAPMPDPLMTLLRPKPLRAMLETGPPNAGRGV